MIVYTLLGGFLIIAIYALGQGGSLVDAGADIITMV